MKLLKKWRRKAREQGTPVAVDQQSPDRVFLWTFFNLAYSRDPLLLSVACWRRVFPNEPLGSWMSRVWVKGPLQPEDMVQIKPESSPNFGGCCMIVTDCADRNVWGYVLAPSRDGRVGIDLCVPVQDVKKIGRAIWTSDRIRLAGGQS